MKANVLNALVHEPGVSAREAAAFWLMRAQSGDFTAADRAEFEAWLASDPEYARMYESVRGTWEFAGAAATAPEVLARRETARIKLGPVRRPIHRVGWRTGAMAAAVLLAVTGSALVWRTYQGGERVYETGIGERSTVTLADGSTLTLNTATRATVSFSEAGRSVVLERGQALFGVARDAGRAFVVTAGNRRIEALGTSFDVRMEGERVQVTLIEGRVAVDGTQTASTLLEPGDQLVAEAGAAPVVRQIDAARVVSWSQGRIIFEDEPLAAAVAEMNRYRHAKLVLADPSLEQLRVSGVFSAGEPARFLDALLVTFPVAATPSGDNPEGPVRLTRRD